MKRNIILIDEQLCNGCGVCVQGCHEGALQMIDGKAQIISELYCDGLGACIGDCPVGAITIEERDAEPYDENAVMMRLATKGEKTILAHLKHLKEHGEEEWLAQGVDYVKKHNLQVNLSSLVDESPIMACGCPGSHARSFVPTNVSKPMLGQITANSELTHWPVQLHLLNPLASYFSGADVLLAADCVAFAYPSFHTRFLKEKKLAIACPKLDSNKDVYVDKIAEMIDSAQINTLTVIIMEVPCCGGLMQIAQMALAKATRKVPIKKVVIGVQGSVVAENWV